MGEVEKKKVKVSSTFFFKKQKEKNGKFKKKTLFLKLVICNFGFGGKMFVLPLPLIRSLNLQMIYRERESNVVKQRCVTLRSFQMA